MSMGQAMGSGSASGSGDPNGGSPQSRAGCATAVIFFVIALILLGLIGSFSVASMRSCSALVSGGDIAASTVHREPLPQGAATTTAYYTDEDGGWISSPSMLEQGLKEFYDKTGVQPYVYILPNGSVTSTERLSELSQDLYDQLFDDEAHFLLVFCDDGSGSYNCGYTVGSQAKSVMDDEAVGILSDYLDRYYQDYSIREEQIFSNAFADTADRIMSVTTPAIIPVTAIVAAVVVVALVVFFLLRRQRERAREREHLETVLNTPLETYEEHKLDELEEKYRSGGKG